MNCPSCGKETPDNSSFCFHCGKPIENTLNKIDCPSCGNKTPKNSQYCMNCGAPVSIPLSVLITKPKPIQMGLICPKCGNDGSIRKVSAIWADGTREMNSSGPTTGMGMAPDGSPVFVMGTTHQSGISQTYLAQKLAPPHKPTSPTNSCLIYGLCLIFPPIFIFAHTPKWTKIAIGIILIFMLILSTFTKDQSYIGIPLVFISWILGFIGLSKGSDIPEEEMDSWNKEIAEWNKLYYCFKHDYIFKH